MPNIASVLKEEIARVARKEIRASTTTTKKASAQHRRDIAALKRELAAIKKEVFFLRSQEKRRAGSRPSAELAEGARFSAAGVKSHRARIGFSAAEYAAILGVSALTVYNWEHGKSWRE